MTRQGDTVRPAKGGEDRELADLWLRSRRAALPSIPPPVHDDDEVRQWFRDVVIPRRDTWVIDGQAGIVGLVVLDGGWIDQLYIDPSHTGIGLGSILLDFAKGAHPAGLDLWTFRSNEGARR